ncbi:MAG: MFS transporter [Opitutales bacterium]|nr:MFS transporter [Opitutales bacterium]
MILRKGDDWFGETLGTWMSLPAESTEVSSCLLTLAVFFPVAYGIYDFKNRKKWNFMSILGAISALLTGGIGLIPGGTVHMFAIKEAALPGVLAILTLFTLKTKKPLVKIFLFNPDFFQVDKIEKLLEIQGTQKSFNRLLVICTWLLAATFVFSTAVNYFLARIIVVTEPFTDKTAFNDEIGTMMTWSFPVISLPCMIATGYAFWLLVRGIKRMTGLTLEEAMNQSSRPKT